MIIELYFSDIKQSAPHKAFSVQNFERILLPSWYITGFRSKSLLPTPTQPQQQPQQQPREQTKAFSWDNVWPNQNYLGTGK